jgi:hypothetical protein
MNREMVKLFLDKDLNVKNVFEKMVLRNLGNQKKLWQKKNVQFFTKTGGSTKPHGKKVTGN